MKHKKIIFVCSGNTCRSPMAEAALKAELKKRKIAWYTVQSAGLGAREGSPISKEAALVLKEAKIPFSAKFASRHVSEKLLAGAHAVVCMTEAQREALKGYANVTSFYELCGREIPDPYGQGAEVYGATLNAMRACMPILIKKLIVREEEV